MSNRDHQIRWRSMRFLQSEAWILRPSLLIWNRFPESSDAFASEFVSQIPKEMSRY
eukprot:COSAG02_NODE_20398_length_833_cov_1.543597_1_plen_55_part_10